MSFVTISNAIPEYEVPGVVAGLGEVAVEFKVGEEVYGINDWFMPGGDAVQGENAPGINLISEVPHY